MKYLKNFRGYSLNELSSGETGQALSDDSYGEAPGQAPHQQSPYAQHRKSIGLVDEFESEFPSLINNLKKKLGSKFTIIEDSFEKISEFLQNLSNQELSNLQNDIDKFLGGSNVSSQNMQIKVESLVNQKFQEQGIILENNSEDIKDIMNEILVEIFPSITINESLRSSRYKNTLITEKLVIAFMAAAISAPLCALMVTNPIVGIPIAIVLFTMLGGKKSKTHTNSTEPEIDSDYNPQYVQSDLELDKDGNYIVQENDVNELIGVRLFGRIIKMHSIFWKLAKKYNISVDSILFLNDMNRGGKQVHSYGDAELKLGQKLIIPSSKNKVDHFGYKYTDEWSPGRTLINNATLLNLRTGKSIKF